MTIPSYQQQIWVPQITEEHCFSLVCRSTDLKLNHLSSCINRVNVFTTNATDLTQVLLLVFLYFLSSKCIQKAIIYTLSVNIKTNADGTNLWWFNFGFFKVTMVWKSVETIFKLSVSVFWASSVQHDTDTLSWDAGQWQWSSPSTQAAVW